MSITARGSGVKFSGCTWQSIMQQIEAKDYTVAHRRCLLSVGLCHTGVSYLETDQESQEEELQHKVGHTVVLYHGIPWREVLRSEYSQMDCGLCTRREIHSFS